MVDGWYDSWCYGDHCRLVTFYSNTYHIALRAENMLYTKTKIGFLGFWRVKLNLPRMKPFLPKNIGLTRGFGCVTMIRDMGDPQVLTDVCFFSHATTYTYCTNVRLPLLSAVYPYITEYNRPSHYCKVPGQNVWLMNIWLYSGTEFRCFT